MGRKIFWSEVLNCPRDTQLAFNLGLHRLKQRTTTWKLPILTFLRVGNSNYWIRPIILLNRSDILPFFSIAIKDKICFSTIFITWTFRHLALLALTWYQSRTVIMGVAEACQGVRGRSRSNNFHRNKFHIFSYKMPKNKWNCVTVLPKWWANLWESMISFWTTSKGFNWSPSIKFWKVVSLKTF